ncbi:MAG: M23 family metallopeptidase [Rhodospirillales bacterium]|jgi:hypothetical protein|nr:M23 family metallopeptidase [Rhodospirillales bacterium]
MLVKNCVMSLIAGGFALLVSNAQAAPPELALPIQCVIGTDCWLVNYVDRDPGPAVRDFACGQHSYDGHKGTDFVLPDMATMRAGVPVLASASGVVRGFRDEMRDVNINKIGREAVKGRECGNGVVLVHDDGWETQYCHMRRGSVVVKAGDHIKQGDKLGSVGLSGLTEMPHVHLSVRHNGNVIDPFDYRETPSDNSICDPSARRTTLWTDDQNLTTSLPKSAIYLSGFASEVPNIEKARDGAYSSLTFNQNAKALVFWADMFWVQASDKIFMDITMPDGSILIDKIDTPPNLQARRILFIGKKNKGKPWPAGRYVGNVKIQRLLKDGSVQTMTSSRTLLIQ